MTLKIARFISIIFNPILILVFLPFFLVIKSTNNFNQALFWTEFTSVFFIAIAVFIFFAVRKKIFSDWDVSKREQRPLLFSAFLILGFIYLISLFIFHAPRILFIVTISVICGVIIVGVINKKIKASLHVATASALVLGLILAYKAYYFLLLLIPIVAWSRVTIKRHTLYETIIGGIVGSLLLLAIYGVFELVLQR